MANCKPSIKSTCAFQYQGMHRLKQNGDAGLSNFRSLLHYFRTLNGTCKQLILYMYIYLFKYNQILAETVEKRKTDIIAQL